MFVATFIDRACGDRQFKKTQPQESPGLRRVTAPTNSGADEDEMGDGSARYHASQQRAGASPSSSWVSRLPGWGLARAAHGSSEPGLTRRIDRECHRRRWTDWTSAAAADPSSWTAGYQSLDESDAAHDPGFAREPDWRPQPQAPQS